MPTPETRILTGNEGRSDYLDDCLKDDLREECDVLDMHILTAAGVIEGLETELKAKPKTADPYQGLTPTRIHVSGSEVSGNLCELVRIDSGKWIVRRGNKMLTLKGKWIRYQSHMAPEVERQVSLSLDSAIAAAK